MPTAGGGARAVFFDRDGTINWPAAPGKYIRNPGDLRLMPGAAAAVAQIKDAGYLVILATNQRWLSEPGADPGAYAAIERELSRLLAAEGARLDASYTCPHAAGGCHCRKPLPGLLLQAAEDFGLSLPDSYFIGDSVTDAEAGAAAGVTTILIAAHGVSGSCPATHVAGSIEHAARMILQRLPLAASGLRDDRPG